MLNSTFGKILRSKQVETAMSVDPDNPQNNGQCPESSNSEAEVRLVVRFIVEEHIVYNGKIERVNQLESEELSRVVSRVAWDSAKENKISIAIPENVNIEDQSQINSDDRNQEAQDDTTPSPAESFEEVAPNSDPISNSSSPQGSVSNIQSSGHHISDSNHLSDTQIFANIVAQQESSVNNTKPDSDISPELPKSHISEFTEEQFSHHPPNIQEKCMKDTDNVMRVTINSSRELDQDDSSNDTANESQSITDTLNDCVKNVDIECRREAEALANARLQDENIENSHDQFNTIDDFHPITSTKILAHSMVARDINRLEFDDIDTHVVEIDESNDNHVVDLSEGYIVEEVVQNEQPTCDSEIVCVEHRKQEPSSSKRKTSHSQSSKRSRKESSSKDDKGSRSRSGTSKSRQQMNTDQSSRSTAPISLLANSQQTSQNKIFAKWSDNHFYPGTILRPARDRKYVIGFFDGAQRNVSETDLIPLRNIEGKQVRVSIAKNYCVNAIVHDQRAPVNDQPMFDVEYQQDGLIRRCVPLRDIFLTGDQGTPLINQVDRNSGASNFADVDLDNIIYEKRSRRLQEMDDFELTENSNISQGKRKRGQYNMRNTPRSKINASTTGSTDNQATGQKRHSQSNNNQDVEAYSSLDVKSNSLNSNPPSESSSPAVSSNVSNEAQLEQDFYFASSSPHRTKTSLLL